MLLLLCLAGGYSITRGKGREQCRKEPRSSSCIEGEHQPQLNLKLVVRYLPVAKILKRYSASICMELLLFRLAGFVLDPERLI